MSKKSEPEITPFGGNRDYTKVTFSPDLAKFGMKSLKEGDILKYVVQDYWVSYHEVFLRLFRLMQRRVYDVAGCNPTINVTLNGGKLPSGFEEYVGLYTKQPTTSTKKEERGMQEEKIGRDLIYFL